MNPSAAMTGEYLAGDVTFLRKLFTWIRYMEWIDSHHQHPQPSTSGYYNHPTHPPQFSSLPAMPPSLYSSLPPATPPFPFPSYPYCIYPSPFSNLPVVPPCPFSSLPPFPAPSSYSSSLPAIPAPSSYSSSLPAIPAPSSYSSSLPAIPAPSSYSSSLPAIPAPSSYSSSLHAMSALPPAAWDSAVRHHLSRCLPAPCLPLPGAPLLPRPFPATSATVPLSSAPPAEPSLHGTPHTALPHGVSAQSASAIQPEPVPTLWRFLLDLLLSNQHQDIIRWTDREGGFQLLDPEEVARRWGLRKRNRHVMTYDKLSRALRYYYDRGILRKVTGQKFAYKFVAFPGLVGTEATGTTRGTTTSRDRPSPYDGRRKAKG